VGPFVFGLFITQKAAAIKKKVAPINTKKASLSEALFVFLGASYPILSPLPFI